MPAPKFFAFGDEKKLLLLNLELEIEDYCEFVARFVDPMSLLGDEKPLC